MRGGGTFFETLTFLGVLANKTLLAEIVLANKRLLAGIVLAYNSILVLIVSDVYATFSLFCLLLSLINLKCLLSLLYLPSILSLLTQATAINVIFPKQV